MDLDTFIIAVFCWIDEALPEGTGEQRLRQRGPEPVLYDSEVLTMEVVGAYLGLSQDSALVEQFVAQAEAEYRDVLAALRLPDADRSALSKQFQQALAQDYFHVTLGAVVREALAAAATMGREAEGRSEGGETA